MTLPATALTLRQAVLAASVIDDIDVSPVEAGVIIEGPVTVYLPWSEIATAVGDHDPAGDVARVRLSSLLRLHRWAACVPTQGVDEIRIAARLLALPAGHALHPGETWVRDRVLGGALECGIGLVSMLDGDDEVTPLPMSVAEAVGLDVNDLWPALRGHAESMGTLAVNRLRRDTVARHRGTATDHQAVLRPIGGLDVPSLMATSTVRRYLAASDGSGMRAIAVPMRSRAWYDLARIDPAFVHAAWGATDDIHRGFPRSLLITADEVVLGPGGGDTISLVLKDAAPVGSPLERSVRFR